MMPSTWLWLGVLAVVAGFVWYARFPRREPWFGPMFAFQLTRLARRGHQSRHRVAYVLLLLLALFGLYAHLFGNDAWFNLTESPTYTRGQTAEFAETYLILFLLAQATVVTALTPVVVGGAVAGGQTRGAFDLLRASPLTNRELALGSLAAGLVAVGSVLLAGVPVLALTLLFGGVDGVVLACGFAVTALSAVSLGAYTVWLAVAREKLGDVLMTAYVWAAGAAGLGLAFGWVPGVGAASPFSAIAYMLYAAVNFGPTGWVFWANAGGFLGLHALLAAWFAWRAVREVRRPYEWDSLDPKRAKDWLPPKVMPALDAEEQKRWIELRRPQNRPARRSFVVSPLKERDPLEWKEREFGSLGGEAGIALGCGLFAGAIAGVTFGSWLIVATIGVLADGWNPGKVVNPPVRMIVLGTVLVGGLAAGVTASGSVAREREKQTLESLFTLPVSRTAILRAKVRAAFGNASPWLLTAGMAAAIGLFTGAVHPAGLAACVSLAAGYVGFTLGLGVWSSVRAKTASAAGVVFVLGLLLGGAIPLVATLMLPRQWEALAAASPPFGLWMTLFDRPAYWAYEGFPTFLAGLIGAAGYGTAGWSLWRDAVRRFRREGRGGELGDLDG